MPFLLSFAGFVFLGLSYHSWYYLDRQYFDLLLICGVILVSTSELMAVVSRAGAVAANAAGRIPPELLAIDEKLASIDRRVASLSMTVDKLTPESQEHRAFVRELDEMKRRGF